MFGKFGSLLSFRGHFLGRDGAQCKRRQVQTHDWQISTAAEVLETRALLTLVPGVDVDISKLGGSEEQPSLAVNPTNPLNMVAVFEKGTVGGDALPYAYTVDGGQTWIPGQISSFTDGFFTLSGTTRYSGSVTFDAFGNAHLVYGIHDATTTQLSPLGTDALIYATSTTGGINFTNFRQLVNFSTTTDVSAIQNTSIAAGLDASNASRQMVVVSWKNNINGVIQLAAAAAPVTSLGSVGTFTTPRVYATNAIYGSVAVGPTGAIVATWQPNAIPAGSSPGPSTINLVRDTDGLQGGLNFGFSSTVTSTNVGTLDTMLGSGPFAGIWGNGSIAYDTSNGPHRGRLYLAYPDETPNESDNVDVYVRFSDNNGLTWSSRVKVNDDVGLNAQVLPTISVDPLTGVPFVGWHDARNDLGDGNGSDTDNFANSDFDYYGSASSDGGLTWAPNIKISDGASNFFTTNVGTDATGRTIGLGLHEGLVAYAGIAYTVWLDSSNSTLDNPNITAATDIYFDSVLFNAPPTLNFVPDITTTGVTFDEDTTSNPQPFTISDDNTPAASLTVTATSSDPLIIPNNGIVFVGTGANRSLALTPVANQSGVVTISVTVSDGILSTTKSFQVRVLPTPDPLPIPPGGVETTSNFSDATSTPIADNAQTTSTITVSTADTYLLDANVTIDISHTRNSDLKVTLISPHGTAVVLTSNNGGDFDNVFSGTLFDDQATSTPVTDYPFKDATTASYVVPEGALAQLLGEDPNGDWTLQIDDQAAGETGTLNGWQLSLTTLASAPLLQSNFGINSIAKPIQDARLINGVLTNGVTESTINLNGLDFFAYDVDLNVDINHSRSGDLDITLISPTGTEVPISTGNGGVFANIYRNTTFNDQALTPVTDATYANNTSLGSVIPEGALASLFGENPNGTWTLRIVDHAVTGTGNLLSWSLNVSTIFVNDPPTMGTITNPGAVPEDSLEQSVQLNSISAGGGEVQPMKITATSDNPALFSNLSVDYTSPGTTGTIRYTPAPDQFGVAVVSVRLEDGGYDQDLSTTADNGISVKTFTVVVNPVNDPPTIDPVPDPPAILEDAGPQQLVLTGIGPGGGENQPLLITADSAFPATISNISIEYLPGSNTAILHYQSNLDYNGVVPVTIFVTDGGLDGDLSTTVDNVTTSRTFNVTVTAVNDAPTLDTISNPTPISEDSPTQTIGLSGITAGGHETQALRVTASSSNPAVVADVSINYSSPNSVGSLSYRSVPNGFGTTTITVTVEDGGTDSLLSTPGDNATFQRQFVITVLQVNDSPVFDSITLQPLLEDAPTQTLNLSNVSAGPQESQPLVFSVTSSNPALIPTPTINYVSPNSSGTLVFTPTANMSGGSNLTITLMDGGLDNNLATLGDNQTFIRNVVVTVLPVNDPPTLDDLTDPAALDEDAGTQTVQLTGISAGGTENQPLQIKAVSGSPSIIPDPVVTYTSGDALGSLQYTPDPDQYGTVTISVIVTDGGLDGNLATTNDNGITTKTFTVTINPVNDPPHFNHIDDPAAIFEDSGAVSLDFDGVTSGPNESQQLQFTASSSDPTIVPDPIVGYIQGSATANLNFQPVPARNGQVTITLTVTDPGLDDDFSTTIDNISYSQDFVITVIPVNDLPSINPITSPNPIQEDAGQQTVNLTGLNSGDPGQVFQITATSSNTTLLPNSKFVVNHTGSNPTGTLAYTTALNQSGTTTVTVTITDGGNDNDLSTTADNLSTFTTFDVTVLPVNDAPTLDSLGGTYDLTEDAGLQVISLTGITAGGGESQPLAVTVTSLNLGLIPNPSINYLSPNSTGQLFFTTAPNQHGSGILRVRVEDGGADNDLATTQDNVFMTQDLLVNVADANDPPTIDAFIGPRVVLEDVAPVTVALTGISGGPNEVQAVTITAVSDNPAVVPDPTITYVSGQSTGSLIFSPVANQSGTANITITVEDIGGLQTVRVLQVIVTPVNDSPTINSLGGPLTIDEDSAEQTVNLSGISAGPGESGQVFNITVISNHPEIIPDPTLVYTPGSSTGQLKFQPLADQNGTVVLTVRIVDGGADNNLSTTADNATTLATLTVNVTPEAEVPVLTIDQSTLTTPSGRSVKIAPSAQLSDADSPNYKNGSLDVRLIAGAQSGDRLCLAPVGKGQAKLHTTKQGQLKRGKTVIGTVSGGQGAVPLHFNFTSDITQAEVQQMIRSIQYSGQSPQTGPRSVEVTVTDDEGLTSDPVSRAINLT